MTFSGEWDARYAENTHMSVWPWSDVVSYVMRYARPSSSDYRVLELGCGAGANIPFFRSLNVQYYAVEGSPTIVNMLRDRFPDIKDKIMISDFTEEIPFSEKFDLVLDRGSLTHNTAASIKKCLEMVYDRLKPGGKYVGIDWFSTLHSDYSRGVSDADEYTRQGYDKGPVANVGKVHFSDMAHLLSLFSKFEITTLEHKIVERKLPGDKFLYAAWNFIAEKNNREAEK